MEQQERIEVKSINEECYNRIKDDILTGKISWNEKIDISKLVKKFGISRSPIVKAIDKLAMEHLVCILPNKGSYVAFPSTDNLLSITELRIMMESTMCKLAYKKNRVLLVERLEAYRHETRSALDNIFSDFTNFLNNDRTFHYTFSELANNQQLSIMYGIIRAQSELFRTKTFTEKNMKKAINSHLEIITAIEKDDLVSAIDNLEKHINEVYNDSLRSLKLLT
jgi:DNA-binding GntR family transcriptional regulator